MSLDGGVVLVDPVSGKPYSLGVGTESIGGVGLIGGVTLVDPETGMAYKADAGGGGAVDSVNGKTGAVELTAGDIGAVPNQDGAGNAYRAYIVNQSGNNATLILEGMNPLPTTIVVRTGTGAVVTGTPTEDNHASTKAYVDDAVSGFNASLLVLNNSIAAIYEVPEPPATGNYRLESVDGVAQWVEV